MEERRRRTFGAAEILAFVGAVGMLVSIFLFWTTANVQGMSLVEGSLFFILAALSFGAFAARSRGTLPGLAFIGLGFAGLALIGNYTYQNFDALSAALTDIEGFYVAGLGSLLVLVGGIIKALQK